MDALALLSATQTTVLTTRRRQKSLLRDISSPSVAPRQAFASDSRSRIRSVSAASGDSDVLKNGGQIKVADRDDISCGILVKFTIVRQCDYGQTFRVVGDAPELGSWRVEAALPMRWNPGHVWEAEVAMPQRSETQFKVVMVGNNGAVAWQPGENRCLRLYEEDCSTGSVLLYVPWDSFDEGERAEGQVRLEMKAREKQAEAPAAEGAEEGSGGKGNGAVAAAEEDDTAATKTKKTKAAPPSAAQVAFAKDVEWGRRVVAGLLGSWGRQTLMAEEEGKAGGKGGGEGGGPGEQK